MMVLRQPGSENFHEPAFPSQPQLNTPSAALSASPLPPHEPAQVELADLAVPQPIVVPQGLGPGPGHLNGTLPLPQKQLSDPQLVSAPQPVPDQALQQPGPQSQPEPQQAQQAQQQQTQQQQPQSHSPTQPQVQSQSQSQHPQAPILPPVLGRQLPRPTLHPQAQAQAHAQAQAQVHAQNQAQQAQAHAQAQQIQARAHAQAVAQAEEEYRIGEHEHAQAHTRALCNSVQRVLAPPQLAIIVSVPYAVTRVTHNDHRTIGTAPQSAGDVAQCLRRELGSTEAAHRLADKVWESLEVAYAGGLVGQGSDTRLRLGDTEYKVHLDSYVEEAPSVRTTLAILTPVSAATDHIFEPAQLSAIRYTTGATTNYKVPMPDHRPLDGLVAPPPTGFWYTHPGERRGMMPASMFDAYRGQYGQYSQYGQFGQMGNHQLGSQFGNHQFGPHQFGGQHQFSGQHQLGPQLGHQLGHQLGQVGPLGQILPPTQFGQYPYGQLGNLSQYSQSTAGSTTTASTGSTSTSVTSAGSDESLRNPPAPPSVSSYDDLRPAPPPSAVMGNGASGAGDTGEFLPVFNSRNAEVDYFYSLLPRTPKGQMALGYGPNSLINKASSVLASEERAQDPDELDSYRQLRRTQISWEVRPRRPRDPVEVEQEAKRLLEVQIAAQKAQRRCVECGTDHSPEWRKGPTGPKTLCNRCGLRFAKRLKMALAEK